MLKYLITGGTGFLGGAISKKLRTNGHAVLNSSRGDDYGFIMKAFRPNVVIHCAAEIYSANLMFNSNIQLTYDLLEAARTLSDIQAFVYVGSNSEYGYKKEAIAETDFLDPRTMYEATKGCGTLLCQGFAREFGLPVNIIRPFSIYGEGEPPHRFIPTIIRRLLNNEPVEVSDGVHDFTYIEDFIEGVIKVSEQPTLGSIYNCGTGQQLSNEEAVKIIAGVLKKEPVVKKVSKLRSFDTMTWLSDCDKLRALGWSPKYNFKSGIEEICSHERIS